MLLVVIFSCIVIVTQVAAQTTESILLECDFEDIHCLYQNNQNQFKWHFQNTPTSDQWTGPDHDHTTGTGMFAYIESSNVVANSIATLESPRFQLQESCDGLITLWYNMHGVFTGTLEITVDGQPVWSKTGQQHHDGTQWDMATVQILRPPSGSFEFKIVGKRMRHNAGYLGDIGIDDVTVKSVCPAKPALPAELAMHCPEALTESKAEFIQVLDDVCYQFILHHVRSYSDARESCQMGGGSLALAKTKAINNFLVDKMKNYYQDDEGVWIGLSDRLSETDFVWEDGQTLGETGFSNWGDNQGPGGGSEQGEEDCVALIPTDGHWHDFKCNVDGLDPFADFSHEMSYICQYTGVVVTNPPPTTTIQINTTAATTIATSTTTPTTPTTTMDTKTTTTTMPTTPTITTPTTTTIIPTTITTMPTTTTTMPTTTTTTPTTPTTPTTTTTTPTTTTTTTTTPTTPTTTTTTPTTPTTPTTTTTTPTTTTTTTTPTTTVCPPFHCNLDCGLDGYEVDDNGCSRCRCYGE